MRKRYPRVAKAFELYALCRGQQLFHIEVKSDRGRKVEHKIVPYTTGLNQLPWPGGMADQPVWTITIFDYFMSGDRDATYSRLKSKS